MTSRTITLSITTPSGLATTFVHRPSTHIILNPPKGLVGSRVIDRGDAVVPVPGRAACPHAGLPEQARCRIPLGS